MREECLDGEINRNVVNNSGQNIDVVIIEDDMKNEIEF